MYFSAQFSGAVFLIVGFIGLYFAHSEKRGLLLLFGICLKIAVITSLIILEIINLVHPTQSVNQLSLLHGIAIGIAFFLEIVSNLLIGISIIRLTVFPLYIGILLAITIILIRTFSYVGSIIYYGCLIWIGLLMVRGIISRHEPTISEQIS